MLYFRELFVNKQWSKLNLQQLRDVCQGEDIDHSALRRKKDLIERINEVREARQAAVEDNDVENEAEFYEDAASVASRPVSQNGGYNCSQEESTDILRLRLQLELARAEERKVQAEKEKVEAEERKVEVEERRVQAEREMMREIVELEFPGGEMRDAGTFVTKSLPEIKFPRMVEQTNDVLSVFNVFEKTCTLHGIQGQQLARILPSLLNEKANKIYSRLDIDTILSKQRF